MLASHRPDVVLPTRVKPDVAPKDSELFALAGLDQPSGEIILKIVSRATAPREVTIQLNGSAPLAGKARLITLHHDDPMAENSLDDPEVIAPRESIRDIPGAEFTHTLPANSLTVMRMLQEERTK
jgi:alpha-L-arabinofuranosidase